MNQDKIQEFRDEQKRLKERQEELSTVASVGEKLDRSLSYQTTKLIANAQSRTNKVKSVDPIASPDDIQAVVKALNELGGKLAPKELKPVIDALKSVTDEISKLPKNLPKLPEFPKFPDLPKSTKVDNLKEIQPWLKDVVTAIGKLELNPKIEVKAGDVTVPETKVDLTPITQGLVDLNKAIKKIELPKTDFSKLESAVKATTKAINSLQFPVPNYILPFKDPTTGKATQVTLTSDGLVPVEITAEITGAGLATEAKQDEIIANQTDGTQRSAIVDQTGHLLDLHKEDDNFAVGADYGIPIMGLADGSPQKWEYMRVDTISGDANTVPARGVASTEGFNMVYNGSTWDRMRGTTDGLSVLSGLSVPKHDYVSLSYTGSNLTGVVYKTGGSGGTTVATLTLGYSGSTLTSVTKT